MAEIYTQASAVLVRLGSDDPRSLLCEIHSHDNTNEALYDLYTLALWQRVWILQEMVLGQNIFLL
jgi:hypothetical protein